MTGHDVPEYPVALARFDGAVLNALRDAESALIVYARELDSCAVKRAGSVRTRRYSVAIRAWLLDLKTAKASVKPGLMSP